MGQSEEELNKEIKPLDGMKHTDDPSSALLFRIKVIKNHFQTTERSDARTKSPKSFLQIGGDERSYNLFTSVKNTG